MKNFINKIRNSIEDSRFYQTGRDFYEGLSPSVQRTVLIGGGGLLILIVALLFQTGYGSVARGKKETEEKRALIQKLSDYHKEFSERQALLRELENRLRQQDASFSIPSFLEKLALTSRISRESIEAINEKTLPPGEFFTETEATVSLVKINLRQLVDFLYKIDNSTLHLRLFSLQIKTKFF